MKKGSKSSCSCGKASCAKCGGTKHKMLKGGTKTFKAHPMYSKAGRMVIAKTMKEHLTLKSKGYSHTKPKTKK